MKTLKEHNFFGFDATMVADSKNEFGNRLSTMVITFPRYILAEMNTHRLFSRNSASSRAIPFKTMVERVQSNPFIPIAWQKDHKGMQGTEYFDFYEGSNPSQNEILVGWLGAKQEAIKLATYLNDKGVTKQLANRLLEPFMWHTVIVSSTEWENFFDLRCPKYMLENGEVYRSKVDAINDNAFNVEADLLPFINDTLGWLKINKGMADIHMMEIAEKMWDCYNESTPKLLKAGDWHIPFENEMDIIKLEEVSKLSNEMIRYANSSQHQKQVDKIYQENNNKLKSIKRKLSIATCARISFGNINLDGKDYVKECEFADKLVKDKHWSPTEHIAKSMTREEYSLNVKGIVPHIATLSQGVVQNRIDEKSLGWVNNFRGFIQERYLLENQ